MKQKQSAMRAQSGMVLIEALIAMLILALGIFGLIAIQTRTIVETRVTNNRAIAIRQIGDLNERIWLNRQQALDGAYDVAAFSTPSDRPPFQGCVASSSSDRGATHTGDTRGVALCDIWRWRRALATNIAGAQAQVQRVPGGNQIRILIAWPLNEKDGVTNLDASLQTTATAGGDICPRGFICHLQFLEV